MNLLDLVFHYRQLLVKTNAALGLTWDEIDLMGHVEALFAAATGDGRRFRRQVVTLPATLRGDGVRDPVVVSELSPGGLICHAAPFLEIGATLEIIIELDAEACGPANHGNHTGEDDLAVASGFELPRAISETDAAPGTHVRSYRFATTVVWRRDDDEDNYTIGLSFKGVPVVINYVTGESILTQAQRAA